jgi:hypothetical protein
MMPKSAVFAKPRPRRRISILRPRMGQRRPIRPRRFYRVTASRAFPFRSVPSRLSGPQNKAARRWYAGRPVCVHVRMSMGVNDPIVVLKKAPKDREGAARG